MITLVGFISLFFPLFPFQKPLVSHAHLAWKTALHLKVYGLFLFFQLKVCSFSQHFKDLSFAFRILFFNDVYMKRLLSCA